MFEIPGYTIEKELGHGGMAAVYLAVQEFTKRHVAIKVMSPALAADPSFSERFLKEATCANLSHPNIITVYDAGEINKQNYIVMEYASGGDLSQAIRNGMTVYDSVKAVKQIAAALAFAHERGYVHRDVKPDNILLRGDGTAVLVDFGIAKASSANTKMTAVGMTIGSPHYMSPEQARGKELDGRSDIYSLGIVLYEALTGRKPYDAEDTYAIAYMQVNEPPPQLPAEFAYLQPTLDKMLAKDPANRYPDAGALLHALENVQPPPGPQRASMATTVMMSSEGAAPAFAPKSKSPVMFAVAGSVVTVAVLAGLFFMQTRNTPEPTPQATVSAPPEPPSAALSESNPQTASAGQDNAAGQSSPQREISDLLAQADAYLKANALTKPAGANALENYRRVVTIEPGNAQANDGLNRIVQALLAQANVRKTKKDFDGALSLVNEGLSVDASDSELLKLKNEIEQHYAQRQQNIDDRLAKADGYLASGALIEPAGANAYAEYQGVLKSDSKNRRAQQGLTTAEQRVNANIENAIGAGQFEQAQTQLSLARSVFAGSTSLASLSDRLAQAKRDRENEEFRRKEEQQRQALLDEQRKMLEELKKAQAELAEAKSAPGKRTAVPNQLPMTKQGKIALAVRFIAAPKSPYPTDELIRKMSGMMRTVLSDFVPDDTQYDIVSDSAITARILKEGDSANESRKVCAEHNAEYVLGSLMEDHEGRPQRKAQLFLFDCASNRRSNTSVTTDGQERIRTIRDSLEPFLKKIVASQL